MAPGPSTYDPALGQTDGTRSFLWSSFNYADSLLVGASLACGTLIAGSIVTIITGLGGIAILSLNLLCAVALGAIATIVLQHLAAPHYELGAFISPLVRYVLLSIIGLTILCIPALLLWRQEGQTLPCNPDLGTCSQAASPRPDSPHEPTLIEYQRLERRIADLTSDKQRLEERVARLLVELETKPSSATPPPEVIAAQAVIDAAIKARSAPPPAAPTPSQSTPAQPVVQPPSDSGFSGYQGPDVSPGVVETVRRSRSLQSALFPLFPFLPGALQKMLGTSLFGEETIYEQRLVPVRREMAAGRLPSEAEVRSQVESTRDPERLIDLLAADAIALAARGLVPPDKAEAFHQALSRQRQALDTQRDEVRKSYAQAVQILQQNSTCAPDRLQQLKNALGGSVPARRVLQGLRSIRNDACLDQLESGI